MAAASSSKPSLKSQFTQPPKGLRTQPFWHMNGKLTKQQVCEQLQASAQQSGFAGVAVLPVSETQPDFLSEEYFARYHELLAEAKRLGLQVILYDDINFPSGSAGGQMKQRYPNDITKRLDKTELDVVGPKEVVMTDLPQGYCMGAVAMNKSYDRIDISAAVHDRTLQWNAPEGEWKVMVFTCVTDTYDRVDYMSPTAVEKYIDLTFEKYYQQFRQYFGKTIKVCFYDDISMMYTAGYRTWTPDFNRRYMREYGRNPICLYPALWYDIGADTSAARISLFGFRAKLMSEGYPKIVGEWCRKHGVTATGHSAGNYELCPIDMGGDDILFYQYSEMPLLDSIFYHGWGRDGFKMTTSCSNSFDRPITAAEVYGAYSEESTDPAMLYRVAMELYARGVNFIIPHGMWYDPENVRIPPLISHFSKKLLPVLPQYNEFCARLSLLLQGGRHVAEIAVMYPIESMEAYYHFDAPGLTRFGVYVPPETDYQEVGSLLTNVVRQDFTFIHPQVMQHRCTIKENTVHLRNRENWEDYKVVIMPAGRVISLAVLKKLQRFVMNGGKLIATGVLPDQSAEHGHDLDVKKIVHKLFGSVDQAEAYLPYRIKVELKGSSMAIYVNDQLADTVSDDTFRTGRVGLREAENEIGQFAELRVSKLDGKLLMQDTLKGELKQWSNTENASVHDGRLILKENQKMLSQQGADWSDYVFEVSVRPTLNAAGLVFRAIDELNQYMLQVREGGVLVLHKKVQGAWSILKTIHFVAETHYPWQVNKHTHGGAAYFTAHASSIGLREMLADALPVADVSLEHKAPVSSGNGVLNILHKSKDDQELILVANSSDDHIDTWARIRGKLTNVELWDPHTGAMTAVLPEYLTVSGKTVTRIALQLPAVHAVVIAGTYAH